MPDIQLSCDAIDFDAVVCGQCKVVTIQMFNYTQVRYVVLSIYHWMSTNRNLLPPEV